MEDLIQTNHIITSWWTVAEKTNSNLSPIGSMWYVSVVCVFTIWMSKVTFWSNLSYLDPGAVWPLNCKILLTYYLWKSVALGIKQKYVPQKDLKFQLILVFGENIEHRVYVHIYMLFFQIFCHSVRKRQPKEFNVKIFLLIFFSNEKKKNQ